MTKKKDEPKQAGRKPRAGEPTSMVGIRVTSSEREEYEAAAAARSMSLAEWIRAACAAFLKRTKKP